MVRFLYGEGGGAGDCWSPVGWFGCGFGWAKGRRERGGGRAAWEEAGSEEGGGGLFPLKGVCGLVERPRVRFNEPLRQAGGYLFGRGEEVGGSQVGVCLYRASARRGGFGCAGGGRMPGVGWTGLVMASCLMSRAHLFYSLVGVSKTEMAGSSSLVTAATGAEGCFSLGFLLCLTTRGELQLNNYGEYLCYSLHTLSLVYDCDL